jgi:hypothetical protein
VEEVYVSGYEHPIEHYGQFYLEAGDAARAQAVREAAMATARQFIGETAAYGFMVYNLGCFYVKIGRAGRSLPALGEALARVPRLRAWIRDDPERAALHAAPAFQALVADAGEGGTANDERHQRMAEA